jgi:DNA-binding transcriptional regulator GbsR (MarR family)
MTKEEGLLKTFHDAYQTLKHYHITDNLKVVNQLNEQTTTEQKDQQSTSSHREEKKEMLWELYKGL